MFTYPEVLDFLYTHIPQVTLGMFPAEQGVARTRFLLNLLDNPQNKLKVIHIAGTSGKGSTAYLTSQLLQSQNFNVGLAVSPHITDIRERFQVNSQLLPEQKVAEYFNQIAPAIHTTTESKHGSPTYFEILVVLAYYIFQEEKVDYAVIETGLGGLYDATNTCDNPSKLVLITKIGLDHIQILGTTLSKIATQKAGIIYPGNTVFSAKQVSSVQNTLEKTASITYTHPTAVSTTTHGTVFTYMWKKVQLGLLGTYQAENACLALAALFFLSQRDTFTISERAARQSLKTAAFPGRLSLIKYEGKQFILDGAHNPQKMRAFIHSLYKLYPATQFTFILAFKKGKDFAEMLRIIAPHADHIIVTSFFNGRHQLQHLTQSNIAIKQALEKLHFSNYIVIENPQAALQAAKSPAIVTGSLYLIGDILQITGTSPVIANHKTNN